MSSGANCAIINDEERWGYKLQDYPYGETDTYEYFGPFPSEEAAIAHLSYNHQNPGGWWTNTVTKAEMDRFLSQVARPIRRRY